MHSTKQHTLTATRCNATATTSRSRRRPFEPPRLEYQGRLTDQTAGSFTARVFS